MNVYTQENYVEISGVEGCYTISIFQDKQRIAMTCSICGKGFVEDINSPMLGSQISGIVSHICRNYTTGLVEDDNGL